ncbi:MAG TPA: tetratricopeptide repeat protein [Pyrinomonadaceae bacterium]|nr:tetratricopeptide repeat protein [Pyrinomonadaceae bacterium]
MKQMGAKLTLRIALSIAVVTAFALVCATATAQSNAARAREHFERAMSYRAAGDPRAEEEFKQAIADRNGKYAEAWNGLAWYLADELRFEEAAARTGRRTEAIAAYREYLSIRPKSAAHYDGEIEKSIKLLEDSFSPLASQSTNNQENRTTGKGDEQVPCRRIKDPDSTNSNPQLLCAPPKTLRVDNSATESNIVDLRVLINEKGRAIVVQPISGNPALYDQAVKLIKGKRFKPTVRSGRKLKTEMIIRVVTTPAEADAN